MPDDYKLIATVAEMLLRDGHAVTVDSVQREMQERGMGRARKTIEENLRAWKKQGPPEMPLDQLIAKVHGLREFVDGVARSAAELVSCNAVGHNGEAGPKDRFESLFQQTTEGLAQCEQRLQRMITDLDIRLAGLEGRAHSTEARLAALDKRLEAVDREDLRGLRMTIEKLIEREEERTRRLDEALRAFTPELPRRSRRQRQNATAPSGG